MITHRIADIVYKTETDADIPSINKEPFSKFHIDSIVPDVSLKFHKVTKKDLNMPLPSGEEKMLLQSNTYGWAGRLNNPILCSPIVRSKLQECIKKNENVKIQLYYNMVIIYHFDYIKIDLFYSSIESQQSSESYVTGSISPIFSFFLPLFSGILLHASGVIRNDRAAVFIGASGAGKSTIVDNSINLPILNDDQVILRKKNNFVSAYSTPLAKKTTGPCQARLGGMFMLRKDTKFKLVPLKPHYLLQCLWTAYSENNEHFYKNLKQRIFSLIYDICYNYPVYYMHFPKDYVDWDAIDRAMI